MLAAANSREILSIGLSFRLTEAPTFEAFRSDPEGFKGDTGPPDRAKVIGKFQHSSATTDYCEINPNRVIKIPRAKPMSPFYVRHL